MILSKHFNMPLQTYDMRLAKQCNKTLELVMMAIPEEQTKNTNAKNVYFIIVISESGKGKDFNDMSNINYMSTCQVWSYGIP